jgi:uncharacterized GH25 family protein
MHNTTATALHSIIRAYRARPVGVVVVALLLTVGAAPGHAHDFWIEPSTFRPAPSTLVGLQLLVGERLIGDPVPRDSAGVARFVAAWPDRERPVAGRDGGDPAGVLRAEAPGLVIVAYESRPHAVELSPNTFATYLGEEGLDAIKTLQGGKTRRTVHERYSRHAKTLIAIAKTPAEERDRAVGMRIELVAERNPYAAAAGEDMPFVLMYEGRPKPGALVVALSREDPAAKLSARSDRHGRVVFRFPRGGIWLIKAVHMNVAPPGSGVDFESYWASLTMDLPERKADGR